MIRTRIALSAVVALAACAPTATRPAAQIRDPESLIRAMHARYANSWYGNLTFRQRTTLHRGDSTVVQTWREYGKMPGRLRIETDTTGANGVIYAGDSMFVVRNGQVAARRGQRNALMVLGFDVYRQDPSESLRVLTEERFLPATLRTDTWEGRPAYVVTATDTAGGRHEFWVDAERLLYVRSLEPAGPSRTLDVRFDNYRPHGGGWLAERVDVQVDGRTVQLEEYSDVNTSLEIPDWLFDPARWSDPHPLASFPQAGRGSR
jgi:outer membrane lipoprotein-sorting protein